MSGHVVSTSNKSPWLSTTTCQLIVKTTFTVSVDQVVSDGRGKKLHAAHIFRMLSHTDNVVFSVAINFVTSEDVRILRDIELYYSTQIDEMPMSMPTRLPPYLRHGHIYRIP